MMGRVISGRARSALLPLLFVAPLLGIDGAKAGDLTFEDRVRAQKAIERVYYAHQLNASMPFERAVTPETIRTKVARYLQESVALEVVWKSPISGAMLREELARVARETRDPDRLLELYAALGNDPRLVQECLIRPLLAARLTRSRFAADVSMQAEARREIELLRSDLTRGALDPLASDARRTIEDIVRAVDDSRTREPSSWQDARLELSSEAFDARRALAPKTVGEIGEIREDADSFVVEVLLQSTPRQFRLALFSVPKPSWDSWWSAHAREFDVTALHTVSSGVETLPRPVATGQASGISACLPDDTWTPYLPGGRVGHSAIWTGSVMVVWGGLDDRGVLGTGGRYDPATDSWTPTSLAGAPSPRRGHIGVWTGSSMLIWGGAGATQSLNDGGRYDPVADTWTPISPKNAPPGYYLGAWSGSRLLVWGSFEQTANSGGSYDPVGDLWTPMSTVDSPTPRHAYSLVWAGSVLVVWGGVDQTGYLNTGGRYDPVSDSWTPTSLSGAPSQRYGDSLVWTGSEVVVWGGEFNVGDPGLPGRYDPAHDTWRPVSTAGSPSPRSIQPAVWTGSRMVVWGGTSSDGAIPIDTGGVYDPATDSWTLTQGLPFSPPKRYQHTLVWTGSQVLVFGGNSLGQYSGKTYRFDPLTNTWPPPPSAPSPRTGMSTIWTGSLLIGWGGSGGSGLLNTGFRYDPALDSWMETSTAGAPAARWKHLAVWTGREMIVWGGDAVATGEFTSGGRYDPVADSWTPTTVVNAAAPRSAASAVWSGREMIIWGGVSLSTPSCCFLATGGRYDPLTDTWAATSTTGAPTGRYAHAAAWTGNRMFVWGGVFFFLNNLQQRQYVYLNDGRLYDPVTDTWAAVAALNAPPARSGHVAIWTGARVLVWGGSSSASGQIELRGGRYDPNHDSWEATSTSTTLNASGSYTGIAWTGNVMIVWGQNNGPTDSGRGGRYDPVADSWLPTSTESAPPAGGAVAWIGRGMLVWQDRLHLYSLSADADHDGVTMCGGDCDDGNPNVHPGTTETCNGIDDNCNGLVDETFDLDGDGHTSCGGDCNDADPSVWGSPLEVSAVLLAEVPPVQITWTSQDVPAGPGTVYDVVSGTRAVLGAFDASSAVCLGSGASSPVNDVRPDPSRGQMFWYLVRARNSCGTCTYGSVSLDQTIPACF